MSRTYMYTCVLMKYKLLWTELRKCSKASIGL